MDKLLGDKPFVPMYLDGIAIFFPEEKEHLNHLCSGQERVVKYDLKIKLSKCYFFRTELELLAHRVCSDECIRVDKKEIEKIKDFKIPTSVTEIRKILGLLGYYWRFIRIFADM